MKTQVAALLNKPSPAREEACAPTPALKSPYSGNDRSEAVALRKKVNRLMQRIKALESKEVEQSVTYTAVSMENTEVDSHLRQRQNYKRDNGMFCYRCGEDGHIASKCSNEENEKKVIK